MQVVSILWGIIFLVVGILFINGKVHIHLSYWKNLTDAEKKKIKIKALCHNIGKIIILASFIFLINGIFLKAGNNWFVIFMIGWMIIAGGDVWYIEKSGRYYQK